MKKTVIIIVVVIVIVSLYSLYQRKRKDVPVYYTKRLIGNYNARVIPPFGIFINESQKDNIELLNHEKIHWSQFKEKGLLGFYFQYTKEMSKFGYDKMPMEIEARENESEYCKSNYSECVRIGMSNTVYNPKFRI